MKRGRIHAFEAALFADEENPTNLNIKSFRVMII